MTLSSAEADSIALIKCSAELSGIRSAMCDFGVESSGVVYADFPAAFAIANRNRGQHTPSHQHQHPSVSGKRDCYQLEMSKVLGTDNPVDLMIKYLTRMVIDTRLKSMSHQRADGRAQAGLKVQGKAGSAAKGSRFVLF